MGKQSIWIPLTDVRGVRRHGPHRFTKQVLHWPYCSQCGLVRLKNDTTRRAERKRCEWWDDA